MKKKKTGAVFLFGLMALILGAIAGAIIWVLLKLINGGIALLWSHASLPYHLVLCCVGAVLIGLWQKKHGILPDESEEVMATIKKTGGYPYDRLGILSVAALLPLIFGGTLGPEAGLVGIIAGLCCWIGDSLKRRGDTLAEIWKRDGGDDTSEVIAETGIATILGVIFGAPLMGIAGNLEPRVHEEKLRKRILKKKGRIFLYCMGVLGGFLALKGCGGLFLRIAERTGNEALIEFAGEGGLPRFTPRGSLDLSQWKWALLMLAVGVAGGLLYCTFNWLTKKGGEKVQSRRILSCLIAAVPLAVLGWLLPKTMFSGEHELGNLIANWQGEEGWTLILTAVVKLFLVCLCINFGWRGGAIFPIIYSGASLAFGVSLLVGAEGCFAAAILCSAMYAYISRKPISAVAILLLCFPVTYIPLMFIAAFIAGHIPSPFAEKKGKQE